MLTSDPIRAAAAVTIVALATALTALRVRAGLHTRAQVAVGAFIGSANGAAMFYASPALEARLAARADGHGAPSALLAGLLVVGALVVGSVERWLARRLKES